MVVISHGLENMEQFGMTTLHAILFLMQMILSISLKD